MQDRTVLAVAHRLATLADMDRIIVLSEGQIVEDGGITDLLAQSGAFSRLWRMQMNGSVTPLDGRLRTRRYAG